MLCNKKELFFMELFPNVHLEKDGVRGWGFTQPWTYLSNHPQRAMPNPSRGLASKRNIRRSIRAVITHWAPHLNGETNIFFKENQ